MKDVYLSSNYSRYISSLHFSGQSRCYLYTQRIAYLREKLLKDLEQAFIADLSMLKTGSLGANASYRLNREGISALSDVTSHLRIYDILNLWEEAEEVTE